MDLIQVFNPNLTNTFNNASGPAAFYYSIVDEIDPVMKFLNEHLSISDDETVKGILLELTSNAVTAPIGYTLGRETGLTRDEMFSAIGTSVLWPDLSMRNSSRSSPESLIRIEQLLGISIPEWLSMQLKDRINLLGLTPMSNWVQITANIDVQQNCYSLSVVSAFPALKGDIEAIRYRFESTDEASRWIGKERKSFEDEDGIYHMPSFTGGGGMGLIWCIRLAEEKNLCLDYEIGNDTGSGIKFILNNHTVI